MQCMGTSSRLVQKRWKESGSWKCGHCITETAQRNARPAEFRGEVHSTGRDAKQPQRRKLKIMQWNCDHLQSKMPELQEFLKKHKVDVAAIQETKMRAEDAEVSIPGYTIVRKDRSRIGRARLSRGGGLATIIRNGLAHEIMRYGDEDGVVEMLCVRVILDGSDAIKIANIYVPPANSDTRPSNFPNVMPSERGWLILGDANCHHHLWDNDIAVDARGSELAELVGTRGMMILNTDSSTRQERGTGRRSAPDISMCHEDDAQVLQYGWKVVEALGSDHYPILLSPIKDIALREIKESYTWNWKKADWESFASQVTRNISQVEEGSVKCMEADIRSVIIKAAYKYVGLKRLRTANREVLTEEIRREMTTRDELRGRLPETAEQLAVQEQVVKDAVKRHNSDLWRRLSIAAMFATRSGPC
jgi:hypothetical protein